MSGSVGGGVLGVFWGIRLRGFGLSWVGLVRFGSVRRCLVRFWVGVEWKRGGYGVWNV